VNFGVSLCPLPLVTVPRPETIDNYYCFKIQNTLSHKEHTIHSFHIYRSFENFHNIYIPPLHHHTSASSRTSSITRSVPQTAQEDKKLTTYRRELTHVNKATKVWRIDFRYEITVLTSIMLPEITVPSPLRFNAAYVGDLPHLLRTGTTY